MPPQVSVVIVTHEAWEWTERALSAVAAHTPIEHEVIVVDNASMDGTPAHLRERFPDVRLIENDVNAGFGPACNQAVTAAEAALVCLLNSDALVEPRWFELLSAALASRPGVAAVVPCVLELSGRVQCAGALVGRDGTVLEYGNGLSARDPAVAFPRAVDFGPAACMVLDRAAFVACGGFDARYAPAYYEDADLCFLLAARGLRTVYEPGAKVRHARYASGGSALARELSARNRERFVARWETTLAGRPPTLHPPTPRRVLEARDACADGRFLVLAATPPGDESPLGSWLDTLLSAKPWARVTLLAEDGDGTGWLTRGVELLFGSAEELLRERKLHYDAVFAAETVAPAALAAAAAHQPQAWHARAPNSEPHPHMLARAGLAPQGAQSRVRTRNRRAS